MKHTTPPLSRRFRRGSGILEVAIVLGVLLSLTFGMVEFGYAFFVKNAMVGASREGARAAIVPGATQAQVDAIVASALASAGLQTSNTTIDTARFTPTITSGWSGASAGTAINYQLACTWGVIGRNMRPYGLIPSTKQFVVGSTMRKE